MNKLAIVIPTYNRYEMVQHAVADVIDDPRVGEIVVCDDASTNGSFAKLSKWDHPKVALFKNEKNLDCYANKAQALRHAVDDWCILLDSDNHIGVDYINRLYQLPTWKPRCTYLPTFAKPHFDYREFAGKIIDMETVAAMMNNQTFTTALNTANFFVHRQTYLDVFNPDIKPHTADSIYMNYRLISHGNSLVFVDGLEYDHLIHDGSHYKLNVHKTGNFAKQVEGYLRSFR